MNLVLLTVHDIFQEENFDKLKKFIRQNKLDLAYGTLASRFREDMQQAVPPTYTAAIMLDHLDWMDDAGLIDAHSIARLPFYFLDRV